MPTLLRTDPESLNAAANQAIHNCSRFGYAAKCAGATTSILVAVRVLECALYFVTDEYQADAFIAASEYAIAITGVGGVLCMAGALVNELRSQSFRNQAAILTQAMKARDRRVAGQTNSPSPSVRAAIDDVKARVTKIQKTTGRENPPRYIL